MKKVDFLMAGVGGQGTILASNILMEVGLQQGFDVKKSEVHGMSQRGGTVESHVRWGEKVHSPVVEEGNVEYLLGFEMLETARWVSYLKKEGVILVNNYRISPPSVNLGLAAYPDKEKISNILSSNDNRVWWIEATETGRNLGNPAVAGVVLLGALSTLVGGSDEIWLNVIERLVPAKFVELNQKAFMAGKQRR